MCLILYFFARKILCYKTEILRKIKRQRIDQLNSSKRKDKTYKNMNRNLIWKKRNILKKNKTGTIGRRKMWAKSVKLSRNLDLSTLPNYSNCV